MLLDASLPPVNLKLIPEIASAADRMGFDGLWVTETTHDPFLSAVLVGEHSKRLEFGSAVAIAFARSPATLAYKAWDLAALSEGRFILGLGTQVKAHITRRFGMTWPDSVTGKLREQIQVIRAFWDTWQTGHPLNFHGKYYKLNLMSPFFNPGPIDTPTIPIYIAGVNTGLASLAGELADGFLVHPLHTKIYLEEVLLPAIESGTQLGDRSLGDVKVSASLFVATTDDERNFVRSQIAFYASTPSYRAVMALHGWEDIGEKLSKLASSGNWAEMPKLISDPMLETFAVVADERDLMDRIVERYRDLVDRVNLYIPFVPGERDDFWQLLLKKSRGS